jgi:hypothetical protein
VALGRTIFCVVAAALVVVTGCSVRTHQMTATPALVKEIGLPVYPNSKPMMGQDTNQSSRLGGSDTLSAMFSTTDDPSRVEAFYAKRIPKDARKLVIPLGFTTTTAYQWYSKDGQKQVLFEKIKGLTIISLQSMKLRLPGPGQSPTPGATP